MTKYDFTGIGELSEKAFNIYSNNDFTFYKDGDIFYGAYDSSESPFVLGNIENVENFLIQFSEENFVLPSIKALRLSAGLTQKQFSELFDPPIPIDTIKSWDCGRRKPLPWQHSLIVEHLIAKLKRTDLEKILSISVSRNSSAECDKA